MSILKCDWCGQNFEGNVSMIPFKKTFCSKKCSVEFEKNNEVEGSKFQKTNSSDSWNNPIGNFIQGLICFGVGGYMLWILYSKIEPEINANENLQWLMLIGGIIFIFSGCIYIRKMTK